MRLPTAFPSCASRFISYFQKELILVQCESPSSHYWLPYPQPLPWATVRWIIPISRTYSGYLEGPENPQSDAIQDAVECGGTQPLYDWHQVANFFPGNAVLSTGPFAYEQEIPDGRLASGNNPIYYCYDAPRNDWPATRDDFRALRNSPGPHGSSTIQVSSMSGLPLRTGIPRLN